jgi:hypothetical protein
VSAAAAYANPAQQRVDAMQAAIRAEVSKPRPNIFKPAPARPAPSENQLDHRIAEELEFIRRRLDQIGGILASDPALVHRHGGPLQGIDLINQCLNHLANVIATGDREAAVELISLQDLKARLQRRPVVAIASPR